MKYEVHWIHGDEDKVHGAFDSLELAQDSVRTWWKKTISYHRIFASGVMGMTFGGTTDATRCSIFLERWIINDS